MSRFKLFMTALIMVCAAFPSHAGNRDVLAAAYRTVNDEYLGGVSAGQFAKWSLQGLSSLDKNILVADERRHVTIYYRSQLYKSFVAPEDEHDASAWAKLSDKIVRDLRKISPKIKSRDIEAADRMLMAGVKKLDKNSKYFSSLLQDETREVSFSRDYAEREMEDGVLYLKIKSFNKYTKGNVKQSLETHPDIKVLIIDLRENPGGMLGEAIETAELFLDEGIIVSTKGRREDSAMFYRAHEKSVINNVPVIILADGGTASAAEAFAAALQEQGIALVVGTQTQGKGTVQNFVSLPDDNKMLITNAFYFSPSGAKIDRVGVKPDICLYRAKVNADAGELLLRDEPRECPRELREDAKIDIDVAVLAALKMSGSVQ